MRGSVAAVTALQLAQDLGVSETEVKSVIERLVAAGWLRFNGYVVRPPLVDPQPSWVMLR